MYGLQIVLPAAVPAGSPTASAWTRSLRKILPGWVYVIAIDGTCYWLCPTCGQKAIAAAKVLFELTGDPEIRIDPLLTQGGATY